MTQPAVNISDSTVKSTEQRHTSISPDLAIIPLQLMKRLGTAFDYINKIVYDTFCLKFQRKTHNNTVLKVNFLMKPKLT